MYSTYTVLDSMHVNGAMTVGEKYSRYSRDSSCLRAFKAIKAGQDTTKLAVLHQINSARKH
jgi:putative endopeptidase